MLAHIEFKLKFKFSAVSSVYSTIHWRTSVHWKKKTLIMKYFFLEEANWLILVNQITRLITSIKLSIEDGLVMCVVSCNWRGRNWNKSSVFNTKYNVVTSIAFDNRLGNSENSRFFYRQDRQESGVQYILTQEAVKSATELPKTLLDELVLSLAFIFCFLFPT